MIKNSLFFIPTLVVSVMSSAHNATLAPVSSAPNTRGTRTPASTSESASAGPAPAEMTVEEMQMLMRLLMLGRSNVFGFTSGERRAPAPETRPWVVEYFNRISQIATTPEQVITVPRIENQIRVLGQEIFNRYGHSGMVAVCEHNRQYKAFIERAWDGIGDWLA
jgi:hypothetical protein